MIFFMIISLIRILSAMKKYFVFIFQLKTINFAGAPSRIRTCDLRIRSPLLYPTELWAHGKVRLLSLDISSRVKIDNPANNT